MFATHTHTLVNSISCTILFTHTDTHSVRLIACLAIYLSAAAAHREKSLQISQYKFCTLTFIRPVAHSHSLCVACLATLAEYCERDADVRLGLRQLHVKLTQLCSSPLPQQLSALALISALCLHENLVNNLYKPGEGRGAKGK